MTDTSPEPIDVEDLELLADREGVEVYRLDDGSLFFTSQAVRDGDQDGVAMTVDEFQNLAVDIRTIFEDDP